MPPSIPNSKESPAQRSVLAINSGSSTIKFALFSFASEPKALIRGCIDQRRDRAVEELFDRIGDCAGRTPLAVVGHRVVHGGPLLCEPQIVTDDLISILRQLVRFAPNHLPEEIDLIQAVRRSQPGLPQVVCFDTAFHAGLPDVARRLPIPSRYVAEGVQRYGFHGLSYTFLMDALRQRLGPSGAGGRVILAHLGNGSSLAAVSEGRPIDTSMGFTPIGGVVMSTRAGDLDPGVMTHMVRSSALDADRLEDDLTHRSGLLALSNRTGDMRELLTLETSDASCRLAVDIYCYEIKKRIGAYAAALTGVDVLIFSGGIGEHAPVVRARICAGLEFLGIDLDEEKNGAGAAVISKDTARVQVHVIPTDEEVVIARAAYQLLH